MSSTPYITRRRQGLYLRVRIPADLVPLLGKDFFTKSLKTADPRRARAEAARMLAGLHAGWESLRRGDQLPLYNRDMSDYEFSAEDAELLRFQAKTAQEQANHTLAMIKMLERVVPGDPRLDAARSRYEADLHYRKASMTALLHQEVAAQLAEALRALKQNQGQAALPKATVPVAPESLVPWPDLIEKFFNDRPSIGESAQTSHRQAFREFGLLTGPKALRDVTKTDVKSFADHLRDRPINRAGQKAMARTTIVKMLSHLKNFFGWTVSSGFIETNPAEGVQPRSSTREERSGTNARRAMTRDELTALFDSPLFVGCKNRSQRAKKGSQVFKDEKYWFFLIAALTGARTEEIGELPSTFFDLEGVMCLDFRHATKTSAGARLVPVLPELKRLGIVEWAAEQSRRGRGMVAGPNASDDWSKWLNKYLDDIGINDPTVVAYSLRHNFRQQLRAAELHPEIVDKVFGHEGESTGSGYGRDLSLEEARRVVEKVKSPIPLEHLYMFKSLRDGKSHASRMDLDS